MARLWALLWLAFSILTVATPAPLVAQESDTELVAEFQRLDRLVQEARDRGDYDAVAMAIEQAIPLVVKLGGEGSYEHAQSVTNWAEALDLAGRYEEAEPVHETAVALFVARGAGSFWSLLNAQVGQARNLRNLGRVQEAEARLREVLASVSGPVGRERTVLARAELSLVAILLDRREYAEAERFARNALETYSLIQGDDAPGTSRARAALAAILRAQGDREAALALIETQAPASGPTALVIEAGRAFLSGQPTKADRLFGAAVEEARKQGDDLLLATVLEGAGNFKRLVRDPVAANPLFAEAYQLRRTRQGENHYATLTTVNLLGLTASEAGRYADSEPVFAGLVRRLKARGLENSSLYRSALFNLSIALLSQPERRHLALDSMERAAAIEINRRRIFGSGYRSGEAQASREIEARGLFVLYAEAIWAFRRNGADMSDAALGGGFKAMQEAVANPAGRALAERAALAAAANRSERVGQLARRRSELIGAIADIDRILIADHTFATEEELGPVRRSFLQEDIVRLREELGGVEGTLRQEDAGFFAMLQPEPLDLLQVQALLKPDEALLLAVPGEYGTHAIAVARDEARWFRPEWRKAEIDAAVDRLLWSVGADVAEPAQVGGQGAARDGAVPFDRDTAHALYRQIVAPARDVLEGKRHVFVVGAGSLSKLPFTLFVSARPTGPDGNPEALRTTRWFADDHALIQLPSVQALALLRTGKQAASPGPRKPFIGFGNPALDGPPAVRNGNRRNAATTERTPAFETVFMRGTGRRLANSGQLRNLARLPGTAEELTALWQAFGRPEDALYMGASATETQVKQSDLSAEVIVFATHGLLAGKVDDNAEPGLVLSPPDEPTLRDDGLLVSSEIAALRMDADWVILSACDTAGRDGDDEAAGLSGVAQAFFQAGARTLLASHWPVRDDVASRLVVRTVELLEQNSGLSRAEAFQQAMREIREDKTSDTATDSWAHPGAWAPFALIGDGTAR